MKKLVLSLAAVLMLTGCAQPSAPAEESTPPQTTASTEATEQTEPAKSYYVPDSPMERATGGAVGAYQMDGSVTGLAMLREKLLVCTDNRTLHLLDGSPLEEVRTRELEGEIAWGEPDLRIAPSGIAYYDAPSATYVTLDENLVSGPSYVLSGQVSSRPLISSDLSAVYFVTPEGIQVMNLQDGTTRMLREEHDEVVHLGGLVLDDSRLYYTLRKSDGTEKTCFVDAATGSISRTSSRFHGRINSADAGFSSVMRVENAMGHSNWVVIGDSSGPRKMLAMEDGWDDPILLDNGYVILQQRNKVGLNLVCYDTVTETQLARVLMPQQYNLMAYAGAAPGALWLSDGASSRFYRWDLTAPIQQDAPVASINDYFSLSQPDTQAMDAITAESEELGKQLGVEISFVQSGNRTEGIDYTDLPDYMPVQYSQALNQLRTAAERLPEGMLKKIGVQVELTDRFDPAWGAAAGSGSYHVDGGRNRISVDMCPDMEAIFYHELFHVMEVQMRNSGDGLNRWNKLNPQGFSYTGSVDPSSQEVEASDAVADSYGIVSGREDRAQIFMYACMSDQQERFASQTMQDKLKFLSEQIRGTFDVSQNPVWEQYLQTRDGSGN